VALSRRILAALQRPATIKVLAGAGSVVIFTLALWVLHRTIGRFDAAEVMSAARAYPGWVLAAAVLLTLASYISLSGFDWLGLKHVRCRVPLGWAMLISFVSHAVSHNAGFAVLTGGSVRLRMYASFGLGVVEVAGVVAFAGLSFALGVATLASLAFLTDAPTVAPMLRLPVPMVTGFGAAIAGLVVLYLGWTVLGHHPLAIGNWRLATPSLPLALGQILIAAADLSLVAGALYLLLPLDPSLVSYPAFVGIYVVATVAGTISHVPGGLGVFEGALLLLLPELSGSAVLAAMLMFRVFYNLLPLLLAACVLLTYELIQRRRHAPEPLWLRNFGPAVAALLTFAGGTVLLVTGAVSPPAAMPRWIAEPAHLLSGAVAAVLLGVSWGVLRQAQWAYRVAMAALAVGALASLGRGPDWQSAAVLAATAAVLVAAAPLFGAVEYPSARLPWNWLGAAGAVVAGAVWLTWHSDAHAFHLLSFRSSDEGARAMRGNLTAILALGAAVVRHTMGQTR
jgi:phosphatidylglycerol lysyltransferase